MDNNVIITLPGGAVAGSTAEFMKGIVLEKNSLTNVWELIATHNDLSTTVIDLTPIITNLAVIGGVIDVGSGDYHLTVEDSHGNQSTLIIPLSNFYVKAQTDILLDEKVDIISGRGLSEDNFTSAEKEKLNAYSMTMVADVSYVETQSSEDLEITYVGPGGITSKKIGKFYEKVDKLPGKELSSNDYTDEDKATLGTALQPADMTGGGDMSKSTYDTNNNGIVDNAEKINNLTVEKAVPSNAVFTDTLYNDTTIQGEVDLNTAKVTNVNHPLVETAVPVGALFTDTVYDNTIIDDHIRDILNPHFISPTIIGAAEANHSHSKNSLTGKGLSESNGTEDPDTTTKHVITTIHSKCPEAGKRFIIQTNWQSTTTLSSGTSSSAIRVQVAYLVDTDNSISLSRSYLRKTLYDNSEGRYYFGSWGRTDSGEYTRSSSDLSGATVFDRITMSRGVVTSIATRELTAANIGAEKACISGSNGNGRYYKFDDGVMICTHSYTGTTSNNAHGAVYYGSCPNWTYPVSFVAYPSVSGSADDQANWLTFASDSNSVANVYSWSVTSQGNPRILYVTAIGRWK